MLIREKINYKGFTIVTTYDTNCESPRENDNLGTLYANRRNYNYDDKTIHALGDTEAEIEKNLKDNFHFIPISYYEHGNISISPMNFNDTSCAHNIGGWDSGFFGFYAVEKNNEEVKGMTPEKIEEILRAEIDELGAWMRGECYGYIVYDGDGEDKVSCYGYIGEDGYEMMVEEAKGYCDANEISQFRLALDNMSRDRLVELYHENYNTCPQCREFMGMVDDATLNKYIKDKLCDELADAEKEGIIERMK